MISKSIYSPTMEPTHDTPSTIERIVMQRVHLIRALRFAISSSVLSLLVVALALWGVGKEIWITRILTNAPTDVTLLPRFYTNAFIHTRPLVQILVLLTLGGLVVVIRETRRALTFMSQRAR